MKVVQLESESIKELREKRRSIMKKMIEGQDGSLQIRTSFLEKIKHHSNSLLFLIFSLSYGTALRLSSVLYF